MLYHLLSLLIICCASPIFGANPTPPKASIPTITLAEVIAENNNLKHQLKLRSLFQVERNICPLHKLEKPLYILASIITIYGLYKVGQGLNKCQQACFDDPQNLEEESAIKGLIKGMAMTTIGASNIAAGCAIPIMVRIIQEYFEAVNEHIKILVA